MSTQSFPSLKLNIAPSGTAVTTAPPPVDTGAAVVLSPAPLKLNITPDFEEIRIDQTPTAKKWKLTPVYKISANGTFLIWQVGFDGVNNLELTHGYVNGAIRTDITEVKLNTSGRNMQEQALLEARQRYKLKYREGYAPAGDVTPVQVNAMKGHEYTPGSLEGIPVYVQPKLDGIRMLCQDLGRGNLHMRSFLNNQFSHLLHIETELREFFTYLPRNSTLDGELYNHDLSFRAITSAVKTVKKKHPILDHIQYWIFDINYEDTNGAPFEKRYELLVNAYKAYVIDHSKDGTLNDPDAYPKTFKILESSMAIGDQQITIKHNEYVAQGYEGIMIKRISNGHHHTSAEYKKALYRPGKAKNIMKFKYFVDEEAVVIGVTDAEGTEKGAAMLIVQDIRGNRFNVRMRGSVTRRKQWLLNPHEVIGKEITIKYQQLSEYGVPRFPVGKSIRDYE